MSTLMRLTALPLSGPNSHYGYRRLWLYGAWRDNFHKGIDHPFGPTTPYSAMADGVVVESPQLFKSAEKGWYVHIQTDEPGVAYSVHSFSAPCLFKRGQRVRMGQTLGYGGKSAQGASGDHCHTGLWINGNHRDPLKYLIPGKVVRLELAGGILRTSAPAGTSSTPFQPPPTLTPKKRKRDSMTHLAKLPGGAANGANLWLEYGPNFYVEFVGDTYANELSLQIGANAAVGSRSMFDKIKREVEAGRTQVTVTLPEVDTEALAAELATLLPAVTTEQIVTALKSVTYKAS